MQIRKGYTAKQPDQTGNYHYTASESGIWQELLDRQMTCLQGNASDTFLTGVDTLDFTPGRVPQIADVNRKLMHTANFGVSAVSALTPPGEFYELLANRKFPVATFIRRREDIDYITEPDIFHEVFGHCPMLTNRAYTSFIEKFGKLAMSLGKDYSWHLFRLFWFTVEFGLINDKQGLRAYGAGIASSPRETAHALGPDPTIAPFDPMAVFRTPYRIDILQPVYYAIDSFEQLDAALDQDIKSLIDQAKTLGDFDPLYEAAA